MAKTVSAPFAAPVTSEIIISTFMPVRAYQAFLCLWYPVGQMRGSMEQTHMDERWTQLMSNSLLGLLNLYGCYSILHNSTAKVRPGSPVIETDTSCEWWITIVSTPFIGWVQSSKSLFTAYRHQLRSCIHFYCLSILPLISVPTLRSLCLSDI